MVKLRIPLDLQMFAEDPKDGEQNKNQQNIQAPGQQEVQFDYEKLAQIVSGKQAVAEDTVLKKYFEQQGLTREEAAKAIAEFKQQKEKATPDYAQMQSNLEQARQQAEYYQIQNVATLQAIGLGIDQKTVPYVLKMADLKDAVVDGKISEENVKKAIEKVLEDVPQLKPDTQAQQQGGFRIGAGQNNQNGNENDVLSAIFGNK